MSESYLGPDSLVLTILELCPWIYLQGDWEGPIEFYSPIVFLFLPFNPYIKKKKKKGYKLGHQSTCILKLLLVEYQV